MDKIINEANAEIQNLQNKISNISIDHKTLEQKNAELVDMYREKSKKHAQTQHLYDTLKKRCLLSQVQTAASENVAQTIHNISNGRPDTFNAGGTHTRCDFRPPNMHGGRSMLSGQIPHPDTKYTDDKYVHADDRGVLHPHQRSGSSNNGHRQRADEEAMNAMRPPQRPAAASRICLYTIVSRISYHLTPNSAHQYSCHTNAPFCTTRYPQTNSQSVADPVKHQSTRLWKQSAWSRHRTTTATQSEPY